jgi:energy-coupling factor transporter ATP-binding protein EcfA2
MDKPLVTYPDGDEGGGLAVASIRHILLVQLLEQCLELITSPSDLAFLLLVGASGTGKSHLLKLLFAALLDLYAPDMEADPDLIPVIRVNAPAPTDGSFHWRTFASRLASEARRPRVRRLGRAALEPESIRQASIYGKTVDEVLADAMDQLVNRGVKHVIVDESSHLANVSYTTRHKAQGDVLKGLVLETGIQFVMAGTYDLLNFRDASAQLGRRSRLVHVGPYRLDVERERRAFSTIALVMLETLGVALRDDGPDWKEIFEAGSLGCVGLLRDWLVDANHAFARRRGRATMEECIAEFRRSKGQLKAIENELRAGMIRLELDRTGDDRETTAAAWTAPSTLNGQPLKPGEAQPKRNHLNADAAA